ncbi:MAG: TylF/MycF/NovP-related O-methyltransferase [Candidatus Saccharibacteria bacterium]|nr:class I SAM-dependent methyltransferase [Candidatus Saccharibacteria bacterium]MDO4967238.1 TylF/MycF/NovP-related O-methyltransferase [Candidatus Saccharibacteria bacterium]
MGKPVLKREPQQVSDKETEALLDLLEKTLALEGDIVEFGCYRGDTSVIFERRLEKYRRENPEKPLKFLWIYDSFEGLPEKTAEDSSAAGDQFKAGELLVTKREVVEKFKKAGLKVPRIRKGFFENLEENDVPEKISFAFLDGDLYQSIKTSLKLVENCMTKDGIIVVHDYNNPELPGSSRAVDEWLKVHPEKSLEIKETLAIIR